MVVKIKKVPETPEETLKEIHETYDLLVHTFEDSGIHPIISCVAMSQLIKEIKEKVTLDKVLPLNDKKTLLEFINLNY